MVVQPYSPDEMGSSLGTSRLFRLHDRELLVKALSRIFSTFFLAAVCLAVFSYVYDWTLTFDLAVGGSLGFFCTLVLQRRGHLVQAGLVFLMVLFAAALLGTGLGDGIHDISIILLPVSLTIAAVLLSPLPYWLFTGLVVASTSWLGYQELQGRITNRFSDQWPPGDLFLMVFFLLGTAFLMRLLAWLFEQTLVGLRASERNYSEIYNATSDAIFIHDAENGAVIDVNDTMRQMFGYADLVPGGIPFDSIHSGQPPYTPGRGLELVKRAVSEGPQMFEWQGRRSDGRVFWVEVALRSTQIGGSNRVLAVVRDIDERKRIEERLRHAEKLEAVGRLAGGVAHDFNNQLTSIISYATLIQDEYPADPELAAAAGNILKASGRASDLTAKLMALSRKEQSQNVPVDIHDLILEVRDLLRHTLGSNITIDLDLGAPSALVSGDPSQLQNCLLNLAVNARDAMPDGGRLTFSTAVAEPPEVLDCCREFEVADPSYLRILVSDTGCGVDAHDLPKIFEPFYTTKAQGLGTGLGLATVYRAVQNHRGCIDVVSEPAKGSRFRIYLPRYFQNTG